MIYEKFILPREVKYKDSIYTVSKIPATEAQPIYSAVAKSISENGVIGMTMLPSNIVRQLLSYTCVEGSGNAHIVFDTESKINEHFVDNEVLQFVVITMIKENFSFLINGDLLDLLADKAEATGSVS